MVKVFRVLVVVNMVLVGLSFVPAYSGFGAEPGFAGKLFPNRSGGFRGDVVWLGLSGAVLCLGAAFAVLRWTDQKNKPRAVDAGMGVCWVFAYITYIWHALRHLDMG